MRPVVLPEVREPHSVSGMQNVYSETMMEVNLDYVSTA